MNHCSIIIPVMKSPNPNGESSGVNRNLEEEIWRQNTTTLCQATIKCFRNMEARAMLIKSKLKCHRFSERYF